MPYTITTYYYKDKASLEAGTPCKKAASGFHGLTLKEATTCKAAMSEEKFCGMYRMHMIEVEGMLLEIYKEVI